MNFLQPFMFLGALAIAIPIFIHFWHQKKGQELDWAATQWLVDKSHQQSRGFRLDEVLLLFIRCLLVLLVVFMLAKPVLDWLKPVAKNQHIHLVEPARYIVDSYKFELEEALKNGEDVYWINADAGKVKDLGSVSDQSDNGVIFLQSVINKVNKPDVTTHLYLLNDQDYSDLPKIYLPSDFKLHLTTDSSKHLLTPYLDLGERKRLFVKDGVLVSEVSGESQGFAGKPDHAGSFNVLVAYQNKVEQNTVEAAISSLGTVYSIPFEVDKEVDNKKKYDWILTDQKLTKPVAGAMYLLSGQGQKQSILPHTSLVRDSLRVPTSEIVRSGQLPEFLGEMLLKRFKLGETSGIENARALRRMMVKTSALELNEQGDFRPWLIMLVVALTMLERWMALKKTIKKTYA